MSGAKNVTVTRRRAYGVVYNMYIYIYVYNIVLCIYIYTINCELILRLRPLSGFAGRRACNNRYIDNTQNNELNVEIKRRACERVQSYDGGAHRF